MRLELRDGGLFPVMPDPAEYMPWLDSAEAVRLERENLMRRTFDTAAWDRTATPVVSGAYEVITLDTESIAGDTYNQAVDAWEPGVPGYYNMKCYLSFTLSPPAIAAVQLTAALMAWRTVDASGNTGSWEPVGGVQASVTAAGAPNYLPGVTISGADTVGLVAGQGVQWGYVTTTVAGIQWFDLFTARVVCERVADIAGDAACCEG